MKRISSILAIIIGLSVMSGCANQPTTQTLQVNFVEGCAGYSAAFKTALTLRQAGKLNAAQIAAISTIDAAASPICSGTIPTDPTLAIQQITAAMTQLTIQTALPPETK